MLDGVPLRLLIVDDSAEVLAVARELLERQGLTVVGVALDGATALRSALEQRPDVALVDIDLGGESGFDLLRRAPPPCAPNASYPLIVFTTAHHEHAVRAFEFAALDYLLKPFDQARFARTLARVDARLAARNGEADDAEERLRRVGALAAPRLTRLVVHERGRALIVPVGEVQRLSAAGNYVEIHTPSRRHLIRATLARLAQRLDPAEFLRVHRSHLVRAAAVAAIAARTHGDALLTLRDGTEVLLSRRFRALLPPDWRGSRPGED